MKFFPVPLSLILGPSLALLVLISTTSCTPPAGNPIDGQRWYSMHNCSSCHGPKGDDGRGPRIAGTHMRFGSFMNRLRTKDDSIMPEYPEEKISKQDAADIYAFLKSLKK